MKPFSLLLGIFVVSLLLTAAVRRYALSRSLMDVPNERSSHEVPTPRGGGVAIVLAFLLSLPLAWGMGVIDGSVLLAFLPPGAWIAAIGFLDDHRHIPARWRLLGHFLGAAWLLLFSGGLAPLALAGERLDLGLIGDVLALIYLVWLLNLYNFMDGIDGIASLEAVTVCLAGALCYWLIGRSELSWLPLALALATAGFLVWNFPPARIFMGDAGSGFLGVILGGLSLQAAWIAPQLFWSWLILLAVFIVDATWTLLHRLLRGERVYEAHRSHAYQRIARNWRGHLWVSVMVAAINLFWLAPWAILVALEKVDGLLGLIIAYAPLVLVVAYSGAGRPDNRVVS
ncbi:putative undecaprenyl-phosphate N-acetylglucosaminyl 1-phosphate transferase [compost metagenome]